MQLERAPASVPAFEVIPFPGHRRVAKIRKTASSIYYSRTDREAEAFWKRAIDGLSRQVSYAGVTPDRITDELRAFHEGVCVEMECIAFTGQGPEGNAA